MSGVGRRERKRQQTADHLAETAWSLFQEQGYEAVTMEAIAEAADVAKGTLYKYFPVKETLLRHRFHREMAEVMPEILEQLSVFSTAEQRIRELLKQIANWTQQHRQFIAPYLNLRMREAGTPFDLESPHRSGLEQIFTGLIQAGVESGEFRQDLDVGTVAQYLEFLNLASLLRWLNSAETDLRDEYHSMLDFFIQGLKP
jgi:AcrR family transcriptional regulator